MFAFIIIVLLIITVRNLRTPAYMRKQMKKEARQEFNDDLNHLVDKAIAKMKGNK